MLEERRFVPRLDEVDGFGFWSRLDVGVRLAGRGGLFTDDPAAWEKLLPGKVVDLNVQEPQEQDLSLQKSNIEIITKALEKHHGNRKLAAKEIGTSERSLYRWIKKYHLE